MIENFPSVLLELTNLQYLYMYSNNLTSLPVLFCYYFSDLIELELNDNQLCNEYSSWSSLFSCHVLQNSQDVEDNCCEGPDGQPAWTLCP